MTMVRPLGKQEQVRYRCCAKVDVVGIVLVISTFSQLGPLTNLHVVAVINPPTTTPALALS